MKFQKFQNLKSYPIYAPRTVPAMVANPPVITACISDLSKDIKKPYQKQNNCPEKIQLYLPTLQTFADKNAQIGRCCIHRLPGL